MLGRSLGRIGVECDSNDSIELNAKNVKVPANELWRLNVIEELLKVIAKEIIELKNPDIEAILEYLCTS